MSFIEEIEFRGQRTNDDKSWAYGNFFYWKRYGKSIPIIGDGVQNGCVDGFDVIPETVGQYTRLKDRNGKKCYHKDILGRGKNHWIVEWQTEEARFVLMPCGNNKLSWKWADEIVRMEIIGNPFDNPELLKIA